MCDEDACVKTCITTNGRGRVACVLCATEDSSFSDIDPDDWEDPYDDYDDLDLQPLHDEAGPGAGSGLLDQSLHCHLPPLPGRRPDLFWLLKESIRRY